MNIRNLVHNPVLGTCLEKRHHMDNRNRSKFLKQKNFRDGIKSTTDTETMCIIEHFAYNFFTVV